MVPVFLAVHRAAGGDVDALMRELALPAGADVMREVDIPLHKLDELCEAAAAQAQDPNLGLHLAIRLPRGSYGLLEYIGRSASTVHHAGERFIRYSSLLNDVVSFGFERRDGCAALTQRVLGHPSCVGRHAGEMFVALVVRYIREITATDWNPVGIAFAHDAPPDTSELAEFFAAPLSFNAGENRVELPLSLLDRPIVGGDPMLFGVLDEQAAQLVASLPKKADPLAKVREQIKRALDDGQPQLDDVARALRLSPRTLQRRLGDENTTFQQLVDEVREEHARVLILNPALALGEVAYLLGFSEISAFTRAFKRWTGLSPSRWRAQQR
jgi:AraC-like DNA-binding protein